MTIKVRNTLKVQKVVKCEDGDNYYVMPLATVELGSSPLELPTGVVLVEDTSKTAE